MATKCIRFFPPNLLRLEKDKQTGKRTFSAFLYVAHCAPMSKQSLLPLSMDSLSTAPLSESKGHAQPVSRFRPTQRRVGRSTPKSCQFSLICCPARKVTTWVAWNSSFYSSSRESRHIHAETELTLLRQPQSCEKNTVLLPLAYPRDSRVLPEKSKRNTCCCRHWFGGEGRGLGLGEVVIPSPSLKLVWGLGEQLPTPLPLQTRN